MPDCAATTQGWMFLYVVVTTEQEPAISSVLLVVVKTLLEELEIVLEGEEIEEDVIGVVEDTTLADELVHPTVYVAVIELGQGWVVPDCAATTQGWRFL